MGAANLSICCATLAGFAVFAASPSPALEVGAPEMLLAQSSAPKTIAFAENEVRGKTFAAGESGPLQLLFGDGTTLTLGPGSEATVDVFVFEPSSGRATLSATLARGAFRLLGGRAAKTPDGVSLATPYGTVALRSAGADFSLGTANTPAHFDLILGGSMALSKGSAVLAHVRKQGYSIVPDASGGGAAVQKTPAEWRRDMQSLLSWLSAPFLNQPTLVNINRSRFRWSPS